MTSPSKDQDSVGRKAPKSVATRDGEHPSYQPPRDDRALGVPTSERESTEAVARLQAEINRLREQLSRINGSAVPSETAKRAQETYEVIERALEAPQPAWGIPTVPRASSRAGASASST